MTVAQVDDLNARILDIIRVENPTRIVIYSGNMYSNINFSQLAVLGPNATTYTDTDVEFGMTYTYRMYTNRSDGTFLHGYPTRVFLSSGVQSPFRDEV